MELLFKILATISAVSVLVVFLPLIFGIAMSAIYIFIFLAVITVTVSIVIGIFGEIVTFFPEGILLFILLALTIGILSVKRPNSQSQLENKDSNIGFGKYSLLAENTRFIIRVLVIIALLLVIVSLLVDIFSLDSYYYTFSYEGYGITTGPDPLPIMYF